MHLSKRISLSLLKVLRISCLSLVYTSGLRRRLFAKDASDEAVVSLPATLRTVRRRLSQSGKLDLHEQGSIDNDLIFGKVIMLRLLHDVVSKVFAVCLSVHSPGSKLVCRSALPRIYSKLTLSLSHGYTQDDPAVPLLALLGSASSTIVEWMNQVLQIFVLLAE